MRPGPEPWRRREDDTTYHWFPVHREAGTEPVLIDHSLCGVSLEGRDRRPPFGSIANWAESHRGVRYCDTCSRAMRWLHEEGRDPGELTADVLPVVVPPGWKDPQAAAARKREKRRDPELEARLEAQRAAEAERGTGDWAFAHDLEIVYGRSVVMDGAWVVLPRRSLEELAAVRQLEGKTWAWAKARLSPERLAQLFEKEVVFALADWIPEDRLPEHPTLDDVSDDYHFGALGFDDDWPETPEKLMDRWAREHEVLGDYINEWDDFGGASFGTVGSEYLDDLLEHLRHAGAEPREDADLLARAYGQSASRST